MSVTMQRRTFLKVLGSTLAAAGVTYSMASTIFPMEERPREKTFQEALAELVEKEKAAGTHKEKQAIAEQAIRLMGRACNTQSLFVAGSAVTFYITLGGRLDLLVFAARKLRGEPEVTPFLRRLKKMLMHQGRDPKHVITVKQRHYTDESHVFVLSTELEAARWLKREPIEFLDSLHGKGTGEAFYHAFTERFGAA